HRGGATGHLEQVERGAAVELLDGELHVAADGGGHAHPGRIAGVRVIDVVVARGDVVLGQAADHVVGAQVDGARLHVAHAEVRVHGAQTAFDATGEAQGGVLGAAVAVAQGGEAVGQVDVLAVKALVVRVGRVRVVAADGAGVVRGAVR